MLCDWLPWNHTAGGNHNFGLVLYNGGTLYIDEGRPLPGAFDATVRNLREIAATAHFTVPRTYEMLLPHLRADARSARAVLRRLKLFFYAAAGLSAARVRRAAGDGRRDLRRGAALGHGLGATETAPFALCTGARRRLGRLRRASRFRASSSSSRRSARSSRRACAGRTSRRATGATRR